MCCLLAFLLRLCIPTEKKDPRRKDSVVAPRSKPSTPKPASPTPIECPSRDAGDTPLPDNPSLLAHGPARTQPVFATLNPHVLAPFLPDVAFVDGGDKREPLHTFSPSWNQEGGNADDVEYEFVYEGSGGMTWPLRRVRVDAPGGVEDVEEGEEEEEYWEDVEVTGDETGEIEGCYESQILNETEALPGFVAFPSREQAPAKVRIRIRKAPTDATPVRFKVRVRAAEELRSENMRRLPRREEASLQAQVEDEGSKEEVAPKKFHVRMRRRSFFEGAELGR
jgi:hypothetical protein